MKDRACNFCLCSAIILSVFFLTSCNERVLATGSGVPSVNGIQYPNLGTAYAAGCPVVVPDGYTETLTSNLVLSKPNCGFIFQGSATITMGTNQVLIGTTAGLAGPFIIGYAPSGTIPQAGALGANGGVQFIYTGTQTAFVVGGSSVTPVNGLRLENFSIDLRQAGSSAIGIDLLNVNGGGTIYGILIAGDGRSTSRVGLQTDNGGGFTGDLTVRDLNIYGTKIGVLLNDSTEEMTFIGTQITNFTIGGIGIDFAGSDAENSANTFYGGVCNPGTGIGVKFDGFSTANIVEMAIQGSPNTSVSFGASATQNFVRYLGTAAPIISDSSNGSNTFAVGAETMPTSTFANLGTPVNGVFRYCPDCRIANPCAGRGTGALAKRLNGVWVCN
jgi:hypothetical protein